MSTLRDVAHVSTRVVVVDAAKMVGDHVIPIFARFAGCGHRVVVHALFRNGQARPRRYRCAVCAAENVDAATKQDRRKARRHRSNHGALPETKRPRAHTGTEGLEHPVTSVGDGSPRCALGDLVGGELDLVVTSRLPGRQAVF